MSKHVCITGCTRGLGRALVDWFRDNKWQISGFGRNSEAVTELAKSASGDDFFRSVDVRDIQTVETFFDSLFSEVGVPDLLVNNAGVINANAPLWEVPTEEFERVVDVNITGVYRVLKYVAPAMIKRGSGIMINLSSGWGRSTSPEVAPYCATKWGIEGLSQAMAQELPNGIAVAAMNPGIIDTDMLRSCFGDGAADFGDASAWAESAGPYLASLDSSVNGRQLTAP
ncbi:MAG TPA: oxidoreductase [Opitutae bacterium]|nr:oxidoreductase [Opitutaceae bacterium]HCR31627.1 oxidoreductase [Opitutae bacterium]